MEIVAQAKKKGNQKQFIVKLSEIELDKVTGIAGRPHIEGRYKAGTIVNVGKTYDNVKHLNENIDAILQAAEETKTKAEEILTSFPLEKQ